MMRIIALYGPTCSLKTEVAQEISRLTGYKVTNRGEPLTTQAKYRKLASVHALPDDVHRRFDDETRAMARRDEPLMIFESTMIDSVLRDAPNVFWVKLSARDDVREKRWTTRKEEAGGRTRQLGAGVAERDRDDAALRVRLYGAGGAAVKPALEIDTSAATADEVARRICEAFQSETGMQVAPHKPAMDKSASRGISPGPSTGVVRSYAPKLRPFGGYITDERSGKDIFVHRTAVEISGLGTVEKGQRLAYDVVEDGFGSFKAMKLRAA